MRINKFNINCNLIKDSKKIAIASITIIFLCLCYSTLSLLSGLSKFNTTRFDDTATVITDEQGFFLNVARSKTDEIWRLPVHLEDIDQQFIQSLITIEDKRFYKHRGVDLKALLRAFLQFIAKGHAVSGASTITMQTVRLLEPRPRTISSKIIEVFHAWQLEKLFSKKQILEIYLTLAPYGGDLEGITAASHSYFHHDPKHLTAGEIGLLVTIPKSPNHLRPDRFPSKALAARNLVLSRLLSNKLFNKEQIKLALLEKVPTKRYRFPEEIPHLSRRLHQAEPTKKLHVTFINQRIQKMAESIASGADQFVNHANIAILITDHQKSQVVAYVGSQNFKSDFHHGQIDYIKALRSPGSTLKPFIYGIGFDLGYINQESIITDTRQNYNSYKPENFARGFTGETTVSDALRESLNIPALQVLAAISPNRLWETLTQTGVKIQLPKNNNTKMQSPSLAIGLGGFGMTLDGLAVLYSTLPNSGQTRPLQLSQSLSVGQNNLLFSANSASTILDILTEKDQLQNPTHPINTGSIAFKTGTSYGYRDAFAIGVNEQYTVAVWLGCYDNSPMRGATGNILAVPVLKKIFAQLPKSASSNSPKITNEIKLNSNAQIKNNYGQLKEKMHFIFPENDAAVIMEKDQNNQFLPIPLILANSNGDLVWLVNGQLNQITRKGGKYFMHPKEPGFYTLSAISPTGEQVTITIELISQNIT